MSVAPQTRLHLGPEDRALERMKRGETEAIARELQTRPCPDCGVPVVDAHDATCGRPIVLDPGPRAYLVIGEKTDGRPIVAAAGNGLVEHRCGGVR